MTLEEFEAYCNRHSHENGRYLVRKTRPFPMRRILALKTNDVDAAKTACVEIEGSILDSETDRVWTPNSGYFALVDVDAVKQIENVERFAAMVL